MYVYGTYEKLWCSKKAAEHLASSLHKDIFIFLSKENVIQKFA